MEPLTIEIQQAMRTAKAVELAKTKRIVKRGKLWIVPSQSHGGSYVVEGEGRDWKCSCPDFEKRGIPCKHVLSVEITRFKSVDVDGTHSTVETMKITYAQNWPAYNRAQVNEKHHFELLMRDLVRGVPQPPQPMGRPRFWLRDIILAAAMKVYSTQSGRRASTDIRECADKKLIEKAPSYNTLFRYMEDERLTPVLHSLIAESAKPLCNVEQNFAVDSTGLATSTYARWIDAKYGKEKSEHVFVKLHVWCGTMTNVITAVEVSQAGDATQLVPLLDRTTKAGFKVRELSADKAYLSHANVEAVTAHGGVPYIPFKAGTGEGAGATELWQKLFWQFKWNREEWLKHYHRRSNIESTMFMLKSKFGASIRSKTPTAQTNEALLKCLAHNVVVLVGAMYELGIDPTFNGCQTAAQEESYR